MALGRSRRVARPAHTWGVDLVAPLQQVAHPREVGVRRGDAGREETCPDVVELLGVAGVVTRLVGVAARHERDPRRPLDLQRVPSATRAPLVADPVLVRDLLAVAETVPGGRVLGADPQRLLLTAPADEDREVASRGRVEPR